MAFETQAITELASEFVSGKSQIRHTLCVAASKLNENNPDGDAGNIIFIDSENTFRADRVHQIAEQRGLDPISILDHETKCPVWNYKIAIKTDNLYFDTQLATGYETARSELFREQDVFNHECSFLRELT